MNAKEIKTLWHKLTNYTYPYSIEDDVIDLILNFNLSRDEYGNYYTKIGDSKSLFVCHLDTVSKQKLKINKITYKKDGKEFVKTDGFTILGADDKTGVTILLNMIDEKVPGTYYFFIGEEVDYVGSGLIYKEKGEFLSNFDRCVSFDRKGYGSIINRQKGEYCCSNEFVSALSTQFKKYGMKFKSDKFGVGTDSALFMGIIPECTNLSVGYFNEHTYREEQDMDYLVELAEVSTKIDWENLPTIRKPLPFDTEDPEDFREEMDLPQYELFNIFDKIDNLIYKKTKSFARNSNFFKPNKEMKYSQTRDIKGLNNFSLYLKSDGSIKIKKGDRELSFHNYDNFKKDIDSFVEKFLIIKKESIITKFSDFTC